ncbi:MAG: hypothetical protein JWL77_2600 [Chthonomonadaceae bacterium]|nr:hypothetical protein [Chthonomonadaceae bacterium]
MGAILGVCILLGAARPARADNRFLMNSMWRGFAQSNVVSSNRSAAALNAGSTQQDGFLIALLFVEGRWRQIESVMMGDGSVDVLGIGVDKGLKAHGVFLATGGGTYFAHFTYQIGDSRGYFDLLRAFPPGPVVNGIPPDPYRTAFPPGPCVNGRYTNVSGISGRMGLTHDLSTERGPVAFFTGGLTFQDIHFNIVGAISAYRLTDGGYPVEMLGQSALFSKSGPCVHVSGELLPAVRPGDQTHLRGTYSVMNADGNIVDRGFFDMPF